MKFKFCGNIDSPEWLISEIIFLTKISAIRLRMICNNVVNFILKDGKNLKEIQKAFDDMNFNESEGKIIFSLLDFILRSAVKFDIEGSILVNELQQLGLPQENADSITKVFKTHKENLKNKLKEDIFYFDKIKNIEYKISYILANDIQDFQSNKIFKKNEANEDEKENKFLILNSEEHQFNNIESKIFLTIENQQDKEFDMTINKDVLGKLINDLNTAAEAIKKFQEA